MKQRIDLSEILKKNRIEVTAPCRVDVSGTWDLPQLALPYHHIEPATTNIAIDLRIKCTLKPAEPGTITVSDSRGSEIGLYNQLDFSRNFGVIFAIASHFNVDGVEIHFDYGFPPKSGLGGSGVLAVTTIAALNKARSLVDNKQTPFEPGQIAHLAHHIENGLRFSYTGCQDQCAAAFGGVNLWRWQYTSTPAFKREPVLYPSEYKGLQDRLLVAYTGKSHNSSDVNQLQVKGFFDSTTRHHWLRINDIASEFAEAIRKKDWEKAAEVVFEEHRIRCNLVPQRKSQTAQLLENTAREYKSGFAVTGAGNGGCVWAICKTPEEKKQLEDAWKEQLLSVPDGKLLDVKIPERGLIYTNSQ